MNSRTPNNARLARVGGIVLALLALALAPATASASFEYDFSGNGSTYGDVSHNSTVDAGTGAQYTVTVSDPGNNEVAFTFQNVGPAQSTIANVYFADGTILAPATITTTGDASFNETNVSPHDLPAAPSTFMTTRDFDAQADNPNPSEGLDFEPGDTASNGLDTLTLTFALQQGKTFQDVINQLSNTAGPSGTPQLQIGIHVINFADGSSESFINNPTPLPGPHITTPAPSSAVLLGLGGIGLLGFMALPRRRRVTAKA